MYHLSILNTRLSDDDIWMTKVYFSEPNKNICSFKNGKNFVRRKKGYFMNQNLLNLFFFFFKKKKTFYCDF